MKTKVWLAAEWDYILRYVAGLRYIGRLIDLARSHSVEVSEIGSIVAAAAWAIPPLLDAGYLHKSVYLQTLGEFLPRWLLILGMMALFFYQVIALLVAPLKPDTLQPGGHSCMDCEREYQWALARWYMARGTGLKFAIFVWGTITYGLSLNGISTGSIMFGSLTIGCIIGQYVVGQLAAKTALTRIEYREIQEKAEIISAAGVRTQESTATRLISVSSVSARRIAEIAHR
jgi:hypothetical protein